MPCRLIPPSAGATTIVATTALHRRYGEGAAAVDALAGVDVAIRRGELTAIMGASGSGKSTLMHCMAGLDTPTSGSVTLDGVRLDELDDRRLTELRRDRQADGTWSGDLASGGSPDLARETMTTGRLSPGRYRVEVHNWAGLPGTSVALRLTFYDSAGAPGV